MHPVLMFSFVALFGTACVRRVVTSPPDMAPPPADAPSNAVGVHFDSDRDGRRWEVLAGTQAPCLLPCSLWLDPAQTVNLRSSAGDGLFIDTLDFELQGARHGVVVVEGRNRGEQVNGVVFTSLGGMALVTGITLTPIGCTDIQRRGGLCTAGLITTGIGAIVTAVSIWMIVDSAPKAHFFPVLTTKPSPGRQPISFMFTPAGVAGRFD
jgi:hypothetical protein